MIAGLEGTIAHIAPDHLVLNVGGVFYRVFMPGTTVAGMGKVGDKAHVYTHLYVREDQLALYGTADERSLRMFEQLLTVSGIGPKVALSILSTMPVEALENAIAAGNVDLLKRVPGIGAKTAARMILEMKGKIDIVLAAGVSLSPTAAGDVVDALTGLGYSPAEIQAALSAVPKDSEFNTEEMVMFALKRLGR